MDIILILIAIGVGATFVITEKNSFKLRDIENRLSTIEDFTNKALKEIKKK